MTGERFPSPDHLAPGETVVGRWRAAARGFADLMVASILVELVPWLAGCEGRVLEVGCGGQPYRHLAPPGCRYAGLDIADAKAVFRYDTRDVIRYAGGAFPIRSRSIAHLFHTEVLEHVYDSRSFLAECRRVLKPGGRLFFTVPFQARYHYIPRDYWRFTPSSLAALLGEAGFRDISIRPRGVDLTVAAYKILGVICRLWCDGGFNRALALAASPLAGLALLVGRASLRGRRGSPDDCLGYCVTAVA